MKYGAEWELQREIDELRKENEELRRQNAEMTDVLSVYNSRPYSNTDVLLGAVLSGGDVMGLAKDLDAKQKKFEAEQGKRRKKS